MDEIIPTPEGETNDGGGKRTDEDLDSITCGSASKVQLKIYFNSRADKPEDVEQRIDWIVSCAAYLNKKMIENGLK